MRVAGADFLPKVEPAPGIPPSSRADLLGQSLPPAPATGLPESGAVLFSQPLPALREGHATVFCGDLTAKWGSGLSRWFLFFHVILHRAPAGKDKHLLSRTAARVGPPRPPWAPRPLALGHPLSPPPQNLLGASLQGSSF